MDLKKFAASDQILGHKRKVLSGFGLGVGLSLLVLTLLLFSNNSVKKGPLTKPSFQGFNGFGFNSSFASWPLSISGTNATVKPITNPVDLGHGVEERANGSVTTNLRGQGFGNFSISSEEQVVLHKSGVNSSDGRYRGNGSFYEGCDIFYGSWVRDESKPYYPAGSCPYVDTHFDCQVNGRPDYGFVKWRWQPYECDIPSLNATDFLEILRGKKLVFVGDSLNRNMWESLVCILRHSIRDKKTVYEISGRSEFKKKGFYAFRFEEYNCSVDFVASSFLVRESSFKGHNESFDTLRLDLMDSMTSMYKDADILIFNTGHWWTHEKTSRGENYYQEGTFVHPKLKVLEAYKKAITTWASWVKENIDFNRTLVFFKGYSTNHFRGGRWNSGGQCDNEVDPILNGHLPKYPSKMRALEHILQDNKVPVIYLNISGLTGSRKDGHPSIYRMQYKTEEERIAAKRAQDCSHWCLPGVPDTWNELLYASLLKVGDTGSRRNQT